MYYPNQDCTIRLKYDFVLTLHPENLVYSIGAGLHVKFLVDIINMGSDGGGADE
jgi:hypothetical protein